MSIVVIGGGVAAYEAAVAARLQSPKDEVILLSAEDILPYRRPALSGMVAEMIDNERFLIKPRQFYQDQNIAVTLNTRVESINVNNKTVHLRNGLMVVYHKLIIATGSGCFKPPISGINLDNVLTLRDYADLLEFRKRLQSGSVKRAAVIGGGVLGLELAQSLLARGCEVTVLESAPALLPRNLDPEGAAFALEKLRSVPGLSLNFGVNIVSIKPHGVELKNQNIAADLIAVAAGTRANTELAAASGIAVNRGIVVDDAMCTGIPGILAAGDVAEVDGRSYGLYLAAGAMGKVAGTNAAGGDAHFAHTPPPMRFMALGLKIFSAGELQGRAEGGIDAATGNYRKLFYNENGVLCGAVLIGNIAEGARLAAAMKG